MSFDRNLIPEPMGYYESEDLKPTGPGVWKTIRCIFHGGSDSMRVNVATGAWVCMNCGAKGGDVLAYHMQAHGLEFVEACKQLGAWVDDSRPQRELKPAPLPPRAALQVLGFEATLVAVAAGNVAHSVKLSDADRLRLMTAAGRISRLAEAYR